MTKPEPEPCRREAGPELDEPDFGPDLNLFTEPRMERSSKPLPMTRNLGTAA
jgi:hypothetical protein